jgi:L-amino acid N-acyltransferase YncA
MIRSATEADASAICAIYNHHVLNTPVTFEEVAISRREMAARIAEVQLKFPWLVFEREGLVVGYAYASRWKVRSAFRYSVETTVYVDQKAVGTGVGSALYGRLIAALRECSMHSLIAGIALPNRGSVALHEKFGFRKVAHFEQVGWKLNQWIDVGYWELILPGEAKGGER